MNAPEARAKGLGLDERLRPNGTILKLLFGASVSLFSLDTYQLSDCSKVVTDLFDVGKKSKTREEVSPKDREKAFEMGARFARRS